MVGVVEGGLGAGQGAVLAVSNAECGPGRDEEMRELWCFVRCAEGDVVQDVVVANILLLPRHEHEDGRGRTVVQCVCDGRGLVQWRPLGGMLADQPGPHVD